MMRRRRVAFGFVMLGTALCALLPPSASRWAADVADVLRVPQMPFARLGVMLDDWLRPNVDQFGQQVDQQTLEALGRERDTLELLFRQERIRADELASRVRLLESLPDSALRAAVPPTTLTRAVTGRATRDATARIELQPPDMAAQRVQPGDVVVVGNRLLVGRLERTGDLRLLVRPVAHPDTGPVEVAIKRTVMNVDAPLERMLLQQDGTGGFLADIDRRIDVKLGDRLLLTDPGWPDRVQGLIVADVVALEPIDEAPLRQRVLAVPAAPPQSVVQVAVVSGAPTGGQQ